jgi:hypothetical protein
VDCIKRATQQPENKQNWKTGTMIFMTLAMAFNFLLMMTILEKYFFKNYFYKIELPFFPNRVNNAISYLILFIFPCIVINFLLIFHKKRYEKLLKKYPYYNGKLFILYFSISMLLPMILLWGAIIFYKTFNTSLPS